MRKSSGRSERVRLNRVAQLRKWVDAHGVPPPEKSLFSQLLGGDSPFGEKVVWRLEEEYKMGDGYLDRPADDAEIVEIHPGQLSNINDIEIPQFNAGGGMGHGRLLLDDQPGLIKSWRVDHEWLRQNVRQHTGVHNLCIVTGFGPSMRPMFNPGDPLLVDRGVTTVDTDGVYFFRLGKHGFIKILQRLPRGNEVILRAKSKNSEDYDPFDIGPESDFEVFGRVLTVWRSEQF